MAEKYSSKDLQKWLLDKALEAAAPKARKLLLASEQRSRDDTIVGKLYFFKYDPKMKGILPKYDKFPMVMPIEPYRDGFLGLNLHYLDIGQREALINQLMRFKNNSKMDESTRLKLNYDLLKSTYRLNTLSKPCIKRYLFAHVRSQFIEINVDEFDKAIQLPVDDWVFKR